jgi:YidC/Oxa1 family membrane protein insertase
MGVMCIMVIFSAVGVGVYWFLNSLFALLQTWIIHLIILHKKDKQKSSIVTNFKI